MSDTVTETSRTAIERGSSSFAAAARLFSPAMRDDASMLYAWCRHCDDVIDGQVMGHGPVGRDAASAHIRLAELTRLTDAALAGKPTEDPVFAAFQRVALRHDMPPRHPHDLLKGFAMDVGDTRYETIDDTLRYAYHVAGVVGVMMAIIMGVKDQPTLRRAADLGIALQLTNIARDVIEDAHGGRIYLPEEWLYAAGVPPGHILDITHRDALAGVVRRLLATAEPYYASSRWGIGQLGFRAAWAIAAARAVYREIGILIAARGSAAWDDRAVVPRRRKVAMIGQASLVAIRAVTVDRVRVGAVPPALCTMV